jgi:hypothetical protein
MRDLAGSAAAPAARRRKRRRGNFMMRPTRYGSYPNSRSSKRGRDVGCWPRLCEPSKFRVHLYRADFSHSLGPWLTPQPARNRAAYWVPADLSRSALLAPLRQPDAGSLARSAVEGTAEGPAPRYRLTLLTPSGLADHSGLMPNSLMIGHHFSASAFTSAPSASGVCRSRGKTSSPRAASRDRTAGSASASTAAALSLPMMSLGVPLGAKSPHQGE